MLNFYPIEQEKITRAKRRGGRIGNRRRWAGKTTSDFDSESHSYSVSESIMEWNGTERNETERVPPRVVTLEMAIEYIRSTGDHGYTDEQIHGEWLYLDGRRGPKGEWLTERGQFWSDWHSALDRALLSRRRLDASKNGEPPPTTWELKQRLEALKPRESNHEANDESAAWCGEPSDAALKELEKIRADIRQCEQRLEQPR